MRDPAIVVTYGGHDWVVYGEVVNLLTHVSVVPDTASVVYGDVSGVGEVEGPLHLCAVNFIADAPECCPVESEGGASVAVAVLGTVVALHVSPRVVEGGGCTTLLINSHGVLADVTEIPPL